MWRTVSRRKIAAGLVLAGIAALLVWGSGGGDTPAHTVGLLRAAPVTPTPVAAAGTVLPGGASPSSALVMVQGLVNRRLVYWALAGYAPAQEIDQHVKTWPLVVDPGGGRVLYSTDTTVMVFDAAARRSVIVGEYAPGDYLTTAQWSPDGAGVAYVVQAVDRRIAYYSRADGSQPAEEMASVPSGLQLDVAWLPDNTPVAIYLGMGPVGGLEAHYELYNPATGEGVVLPPDVDTIQPWEPWRSPDGTQQVYSMRAWEQSKYQGGCQYGPLGITDDRWLYVAVAGIDSPRKPAFELPGVYLDRATWLADGRVLARGFADPLCTDTPTGLYMARVGETPALLVETGPTLDTDDDTKVLWSVSYALSPDQTLVAWSHNDEGAQESYIWLTPLAGGATSALYHLPPAEDDLPFAYQDSQMILYFVWLP